MEEEEAGSADEKEESDEKEGITFYKNFQNSKVCKM